MRHLSWGKKVQRSARSFSFSWKKWEPSQHGRCHNVKYCDAEWRALLEGVARKRKRACSISGRAEAQKQAKMSTKCPATATYSFTCVVQLAAGRTLDTFGKGFSQCSSKYEVLSCSPKGSRGAGTSKHSQFPPFSVSGFRFPGFSPRSATT